MKRALVAEISIVTGHFSDNKYAGVRRHEYQEGKLRPSFLYTATHGRIYTHL